MCRRSEEDVGGSMGRIFPAEFFNGIDGKLVPILRNMPDKVYGCDKEAGRITAEWADKSGLSRDVLIGIGNIDSHSGA